MRTRTSLRGLTLLSLTTLLVVALYAVGISTAETNVVSSLVEVPSIEKPLRGRGELTSDNVAVPAASPPVCPAIEGSQCVLTADAVLDRTLVLKSQTVLDCQGHKLQPKLASSSALDPLPPQVGIF